MEGEDRKIPKWLRKIQDGSWEAELLISGGAIFSLVQSSDLITQWGVTLKENYGFRGLDETLIWVTLAISGLTIGFVCHLFLRGFWIALVCLNSAFPNGANNEKLRISEKYRNDLTSYSLTDRIVRLDHWSGLIFFSSIIFSIVTIGILVHATITFVASSFFEWAPLAWVLAFFFVIHYFDLLTAGLIFRSNALGRFYRPIYTINNYLSLGFLYRAPLQILVTNLKRPLFIFLILVLVLASSLLSYESLRTVLRLPDFFALHEFPATLRTHLYRDSFYMDRVEDRVDWACIQSDIIHDSHVKLFVPYRSSFSDNIREQGALAFESIVQIDLNRTRLDSLDWIAYRFNKTSQIGIVAYIPIHDLPKGKNELTLHVKGEELTRITPHVTIPFWKD